MKSGSKQLDNFFCPAVSIITVNYNGIRYLADLFNSISKLDYPKDRIQTIMVDNCSNDSSVDFVENNYPHVEIIRMAKNTGFAGGNNAGFKAATGDYIALINNDCMVGTHWLKELTRFAVEKNCIEKFGAAGSKVLFFYSYLIAELSITGSASALISDIMINPDISSNDTGSDGLKIRSFFLSDTKLLKDDMDKSIKFLKNCHPIQARKNDKHKSYRITNGAIIGFPIVFSSSKTNIEFDVCLENAAGATQNNPEIKINLIKYAAGIQNQNLPRPVTGFSDNTGHCDDLSHQAGAIEAKQDDPHYFSQTGQKPQVAGLLQSAGGLYEPEPVGRKQVYSGLLQAENSIINIEINKKDYDFRQRIINSCGLEINRSFYARDRGANAIDSDRFKNTEEIFSPSGSSLLISKKCLEDTGILESGFFTYYEDLDLFWRARLKGWKMYFVPQSVASHHHCGTGTEWSKTFIYHVLRNRLLAIYRCGWPKLVIRSLAAFTAALILSIAGLIKSFLMGRRQDRPDIPIRIRIFFELFYLLPLQFFKRLRIRKTSTANEHYIKKWITDF